MQEIASGEPHELVLENARRKAWAGWQAQGGGATILGVDTDVALDGETLGKAADVDGARARLEALSGRKHQVLSGVAVVEPGAGGSEPAQRSAVALSEVTFRDLDEATLARYLRSGEWQDRAGAYAIQGLGSTLIARVEGDFSNVVGLPLATVIELLPDLLRDE